MIQLILIVYKESILGGCKWSPKWDYDELEVLHNKQANLTSKWT